MENKEKNSDNVIYTKQELLNMGFLFDLNGNIISPTEESEHVNYTHLKEGACHRTKCS